ncbi:MAG: DUF1540 domain-containing protein [Bacillota bacterium]
MTEVKCSVDNCEYWSNEKCTAEQIEVAPNAVTAGKMDIEAGSINQNSDNSAETKCVTFRPNK